VVLFCEWGYYAALQLVWTNGESGNVYRFWRWGAWRARESEPLMGVWSCAPGVPGQIVGGEDCLKLKAFKLNAEQKFGSFADFSIWRIQGRRRMSIFIPSAVVASKNAKWRQILTKIELLAVQGLKVIQDHQSWCAHMRLCISYWSVK